MWGSQGALGFPSHPLPTEGATPGMGCRGPDDKAVLPQGFGKRQFQVLGTIQARFLDEALRIWSTQSGRGLVGARLSNPAGSNGGMDLPGLTLRGTDKRGQLWRWHESEGRGVWCRTRDRKELWSQFHILSCHSLFKHHILQKRVPMISASSPRS